MFGAYRVYDLGFEGESLHLPFLGLIWFDDGCVNCLRLVYYGSLPQPPTL